jgi:hypothetical protein
MNIVTEKNVDPINEMTCIALSFLNLPSRGFKESYRSTTLGKLIHDSERCRLSLIWGGWDPADGNSVHIRYGRLHALNEKETMLWNEEECRCWHRVEYALHFLDGRALAEVAKLNYSHFITSSFYQKDMQQKFERRQPEWLAEMHLTIWKHYGSRLFDLFDLRHPDLWQQYRQFLQAVYDIAGRKPRPGPPMDKVC